MSDISQHTGNRQAIAVIKQRIQASQTRAVLAVNAELLGVYWDIGRQLDAFITKDIPLAVRSQLPTVQEIESELTALMRHEEDQPND